MKNILLHEMTGHDLEILIKEKKIDKIFVIFGSTENHGNHLPYGNDTFIPQGIAIRAARELGNSLVLPPVYYGFTPQHMKFPLTITLKSQTLFNIAMEIFGCVAEHGFK